MTYDDVFELCPADVARSICAVAIRERNVARMEILNSNQMREEYVQSYCTPMTPEQRQILQRIDEAALQREYKAWLGANRAKCG